MKDILLIACIAAPLLGASTFAIGSEPTDSDYRITYESTPQESSEVTMKENTFWIFGPFGFEHLLDGGKSSGAALLSGYFEKQNGSSELKIGLAAEYLIYPDGNGRGLAYGVRGIFGNRVAVGPSVAYVTRAAKGVAFRLGMSFPFGKDVVPFNFELGLGFQF